MAVLTHARLERGLRDLGLAVEERTEGQSSSRRVLHDLTEGCLAALHLSHIREFGTLSLPWGEERV